MLKHATRSKSLMKYQSHQHFSIAENPKQKKLLYVRETSRGAAGDVNGELRPGVRVHAYLHCVANYHLTRAAIVCFMQLGENTHQYQAR